MKKEDKIKEEIKKWIDDNRGSLPLNVDSWEIHVSRNKENKKPASIELGKYNARIMISDPFYKPYSKTFLL
ncbi:hypothetical protein [Chryseobacterium phocaeense]|uniref:hypothetical protein n=1 Tax=Chryseobacterium phocaeense TaxID=1816690 RepID=UPI0013EEF914|nr:hypothetical protein [Chryseobacterium phocaeense]